MELAQDDVVVLVGPNNSGKSSALRGVQQKIENGNAPNPVVSSIRLELVGSVDDLRIWADSALANPQPPAGGPQYRVFNTGFNQEHFNSWWKPSGLGPLTRVFCNMLNADARLHAADAASNIDFTYEPLQHPIHFLYRDDALEDRISQQFKRAFGVDLTVHRAAGSRIPLYTGPRPQRVHGQDRVSRDFVTRLELLPPLQTQGDGMRSFAGTLLEASFGSETILLIDEPEAFLHPPQARLIGSMLVRNKVSPRQLIVATHSGDVLRGILDVNSPTVRVARIQRDGPVNGVRELSNDRLNELWKDPLLRHSNLLDSLFHERVVLAEADADCRFYAAILDAILVDDIQHPDTMFIHCGGKDRMPKVLRALAAIGVGVSVVADFDVLRDENPLRGIVEALGGTWADIEGDWRRVKNAVEGTKPELNSDEVVAEIKSELDRVHQGMFPVESRRVMSS